MKPYISQHVLYAANEQGVPALAIITDVVNETTVNLAVFTYEDGHPLHYVKNVVIAGDSLPTDMARWSFNPAPDHPWWKFHTGD